MKVALWRPATWPETRPAGWALVAHGRNGATDQPQIAILIRACLDRALAVAAPELCCSAANGSAGAAGDFTMEAHCADAAAAADWAAREAFADMPGPRLYIGHSMGAFALGRLAAERPEAATGVLAVSPVISGAALLATRRAMGPGAVEALRRELPHAFEEYPRHDLAPIMGALTARLAIIVGADDTITPAANAAALAGMAANCVRSDILPGEHHCPVGAGYAESVGAALDRLIAG